MRIGYDDGYLSPGHDIMPGAWVGTIKSQLTQSLYELTPRDWSQLFGNADRLR